MVAHSGVGVVIIWRKKPNAFFDKARIPADPPTRARRIVFVIVDSIFSPAFFIRRFSHSRMDIVFYPFRTLSRKSGSNCWLLHYNEKLERRAETA